MNTYCNDCGRCTGGCMRKSDVQGEGEYHNRCHECEETLQARVLELENSFFCPHCNAKFPTTADGAIEALEHEQTCKQSPIVQERDALRAENARLWEALVFARDFIMSGPRPGDEMMAVQRISAALKPAGGES